MPDFTLLNGLTGQEVNFTRDIRGKSALVGIIFFNTGCSPCMAEMDEMSNSSKELGEENIKVFGIAVDKRGIQSVKAYNEIYGFQVTYLLDPTFSMPPRFGFTYTPASLILDREGTIVFHKGGFDPVKERGLLTREIKNLLR